VAAFVGLTGIQAGPIFLSALKEVGIGLFLGGIVVTLLPQLIGLSFGHFTLRMNPIILLGALAGGQSDGGYGRCPGALGKPRCGAGLYASISSREHPAHKLGIDHRLQARCLRWVNRDQNRPFRSLPLIP
jgi:Predicted Permease Membrane Region